MPTTETAREATVHLGAYVPADLRDELERLAGQNFRTLSAELRLAVTRHVEASSRSLVVDGVDRGRN